jgi:hypothetical protein
MISGVDYKRKHPIYCFFCQKMGAVSKAHSFFYLQGVAKGMCLVCARDKLKISMPEKEKFYDLSYTTEFDHIITHCKELPVGKAVKITNIESSWSSMRYAVERISAGMGCPLVVKIKKNNADGEHAIVWRETLEDKDWKSPSYMTPREARRLHRKRKQRP